jgi:hypothetical protein
MIRSGAVLCLLLVGVSAFDAIHVHRGANPFGSAPDASNHYCLLCLAAHLPVTIYATPTAPMPLCSRPAYLVPPESRSYESASIFPLCTRPPPQA